MFTTNLFMRPVDVLFLRGNRRFGGPGDHGDILMPPWPSVFTGAVCSRMLADADLLGRAAAMGDGAPALIDEIAGSLTLDLVALADDKNNDLYFPAPADVVFEKISDNEARPHIVRPASPTALSGCASSTPVTAPAGIRSSSPVKPESGWWLRLEGLRRHLSGEKIAKDHLIHTRNLWKSDYRLGITLDPGSRTAEEGRIYTSEAVAMSDGIGFVASFRHEKGKLPTTGLVRLGGDGRGAEVFPFSKTPSDLGRPQASWKKFRMILSTPCPSPDGWLPPGVVERDRGIYVLETAGFRARLHSATVTRHEVISGWDVARHAPKPAIRMIPAGSVYWFEVEQGDSSVLEGVWSDGLLSGITDTGYDGRRREGFGRVWFGKA